MPRPSSERSPRFRARITSRSDTGATFTCQIDYSDGTSATADGTVTDGDKGDVSDQLSKG